MKNPYKLFYEISVADNATAVLNFMDVYFPEESKTIKKDVWGDMEEDYKKKGISIKVWPSGYPLDLNHLYKKFKKTL